MGVFNCCSPSDNTQLKYDFWSNIWRVPRDAFEGEEQRNLS